MNEPWLWNENDLLSLIKEGEQESLTMDYKQCDALGKTDGKKREISKDVSSFANSAGGTIVYGVVENGHVPTALDVGFDPNDISKEWLEQVVNSSIHRKIDGVRINQVRLDNSKPGKVAYVVYVPQSTRAPHQAADKKFYKRYNFESVPMEEYEVRDVMRRLETPDLRPSLSFKKDSPMLEWPLDLGGGPMDARHDDVRIFGIVQNDGAVPAEYVVMEIFIEEMPKLSLPNGWTCTKGITITANDEEWHVTLVQFNWGIPNKMPLFASVKFCVTDDGILLKLPKRRGFTVRIAFRLRSPRMEPRTGIFKLRRELTSAVIEEVGGLALGSG